MRKRVKNGTLLEYNKIKVSKEINNTLYFECNDEALMENFVSFDVIESVAAFMKVDDIQKDDTFWDIKFNKQWNSSPEKALYWLTGGNKEWIEGNNYKYSWGEVYHIFLYKYSDIIYDIIDKANTLGDIRKGFNKRLSIQKLYEFALDNGLVK